MNTNEPKTQAKCPNCGSTNFFVQEYIVNVGEVSEDEPNVINCYTKTCGTDNIQCTQCDTDLSEWIHDSDIIINFN